MNVNHPFFPHFTIYTKDNCPYCIEAEAILRNRNLLYDKKQIGVDVSREFVLKEFPSMKTVPVITFTKVVLDEGIETLSVTLIGGCSDLREYLGI